ncbi:MAG: hypothetical protein JXQ73_09195 [Phycisphaerae bacterium]|nr:hypothetical protein [Phycisphaerae bacterium]
MLSTSSGIRIGVRSVTLAVLALGIAAVAVPLAAAGGKQPAEDADKPSVQEESEQTLALMAAMSAHLDYLDKWHATMVDEEKVLLLAAQTIVEASTNTKSPKKGIDVLRDALAKTKPLQARNAIRFAIKDLLEEGGEWDAVIQEMAAVIAENAGGEAGK